MINNEILLNADNIYTNENQKAISKMIDKNPRTKWVGGQFPAYIQIKLDSCFDISKLALEFSKNSYTLFSVFASEDGADYTEVLSQQSELTSKGRYEFDCDFCAAYLRILIKYNSHSPYAELKNIELFGKKIDRAVSEPKYAFPEDFEDSKYNVSVSDSDTVSELYALVSRTVGEKYKDWFSLEIVKSEKEFFELSKENGKVKIIGSSGVNIASGINYFYKYYCNVHISQVGNNIKMPESIPEIESPVHFETPFKVRYSYNYCALSYTMAFWGEDEWQKELDWLALNGVNVVLDITAQEEVWRRFLAKLGYNNDEIKSFIVGPAYYAWFNMANIYAVGGPVHDGFFKKRTDLARRNHLYMRKMGMMPVLQGYSGMVPKDIKDHVPNAKVIAQGLWNDLPRPYMLKTDSKTYIDFARLFYACQKEVFGDITKYFATDPFHEGGSSGSMKVQTVAKQIVSLMTENNPDSVWIIQSWGENPSKELVEGLRGNKEHALILDLYAEKRPRWENYLSREFMSTPWAYCMLNNFGGRMGLHGHLRTIAKEVSRASKEAKFMAGIGITPEATHSNPIVFDLFFETMWTKSEEVEPIELESWLKNYVIRRYGGYTDSIFEAMKILNDTVYNPELNECGEGAPESVINARPALKIKSASTWGNGVIAYDKKLFEKAVALFVKDYDKFKDSEGYLYDLADLLKQVLSNTAQEYQLLMAKAYERKDLIGFEKWSDKFLEIIKYTDEVLACQKEFLLGTWIEGAKNLASDFDDFTKKIFEFNARALITTWAGARLAADNGGLKDYSNKQWAGLTKDFYLERWSAWVKNCKAELSGKPSEDIDFFKFESRWDWQNNEYSTEISSLSLKDAAEKILTVYSVDRL